MKRISKKILIIILILLILNNLCITSIYAADNYDVNDFGDFIGGLFSGIIGALTILYRAPAVIIGALVDRFMGIFALGENANKPTLIQGVTIFDILFNKVDILSVDFFDLSNPTSLVGRFRVNIAAWFYIMRNVAAGILLVILIYVGIRMAISTVASDRAMFKRMFADWAVSLFLIFILNYIIIFTIGINNSLVNTFAKIMNSNKDLAATMKSFGSHGIKFLGGISSIVAAIIYIMLIWQTIALFFSYFNRMLKVAFLIIIAPLISLTYSIDKMGDGKAQALDAWLKEFVYTILMQPFHCAIYMSLISTSINLLTKTNLTTEISQTLGAGVLALVCITFTKEAEKIVRKIFAFQDDNKDTSLVAGVAVASMAMNKAKSFGTTGAKAIQSGKNFFKDGRDAFSLANMKAEGIAAYKYLKGEKGEKDEQGNQSQKDFSTIRAEERAKVYDAKAEKWEKRFESASKDKDVSERIKSRALDQEKERLGLESGREMSPEELDAVARFNVAKKLAKGQEKANKEDSKIKPKDKDEKTKNDNSSKKKIKEPTNEKIKGKKFVPFEETRNVIAKNAKKDLTDSLKKSTGFFTGSAAYGLTGKASTAVATAVATNKATEEFSKNRKKSFVKGVDKLAEKHSEKQDKSKLLQKVAKNSADYNLDGDKIPEKLQSIIEELKKEANGPLDEENIKNTIISNKKNPEKVVPSVLPNVDSENLTPAQTKLQDYAVEYSIANKFSSANEMGISTASIVQSITSEPVIPKGEQLENLRIGLEFIKENDGKTESEDESKVREDIIKIVKENPERLTGIYEELETVVNEEREIKLDEIYNTGSQGDVENRANIKEYEKKLADYEKKKALLIRDAINAIEEENKNIADNIIDKLSKDVENLLDRHYNKDDKELKELQEKLKNLKNNIEQNNS